MKKFLSFILTILLISMPIQGVSKDPKIEGDALKRAYELHIPIACLIDDRPEQIGTGFPISKNEVATAGHVSCDNPYTYETYPTLISLDHGKTWMEVPDDAQFTNGEYDFKIMILPGGVEFFKKPAKFREPVLGEEVSGFGLMGVADLHIASKGYITYVAPDYYVATNIPYGGFSGSALVGEDGKVVGIVNWGVVDERLSATTSAGLQGSLLADMYKSFLEFKKVYQADGKNE